LMARAWAAAYRGRMRLSRELFDRIVDHARRRGMKQAVASTLCELGTVEALYGNHRRAVALASAALANEPGSLAAASVLASARRPHAAQPLVAEWLRSVPPSAIGRTTFLPFINAQIEWDLGHIDAALDALRAAPYEVNTSGHFGLYSRGLVYLAANNIDAAIREFTRLLEHPGLTGIGLVSPYRALTPLHLARAFVKAGHLDRARMQYEAFLELWNDADPDVPILIEARREYHDLR
jgi:tetratricopeptide (TPR) repeat protein